MFLDLPWSWRQHFERSAGVPPAAPLMLRLPQ